MKDLTVKNFSEIITPADTQQALAAARNVGKMANLVSGLTVFEDHQKLRSQNTNKAQHRDLSLFGNFINSIYDSAEHSELRVPFRLSVGQLHRDPAAWQIVTHGLVKLFKKHLENQGFSLGSINRTLSSIRKYANLAAGVEQLDSHEYVLIKGISGYLGSEFKHVNAERPVVRRSTKKEEAVSIPPSIIGQLMSEETYPDTPIGKRNRLILCLVLDLGLRSSELAGLKLNNIDLETEMMVVYREKTNSTDRLMMTPGIITSMRGYIACIPAPPHSGDQPLLLAGTRTGVLRRTEVSPSAVSKVVTKYGKQMALEHNLPSLAKLSAHDGRHQWATDVLAAGTQIDRLQQAGGWKSPAMPLRYANKKKIANEGVKLKR